MFTFAVSSEFLNPYYYKDGQKMRRVLDTAIQDIVSGIEGNLVEGLGVSAYIKSKLQLIPVANRYLRVTPGPTIKTVVECEGAFFTPAAELVPTDSYIVFIPDKETSLFPGDVARIFMDNPGAFEVSSGGVRFRAVELDQFEFSPKSVTKVEVARARQARDNGEEPVVGLSAMLRYTPTDAVPFVSFDEVLEDPRRPNATAKAALHSVNAFTGSMMAAAVAVSVPVTLSL